MPYALNKIIHQRDYETFFQSLEFTLNETIQFPYIAGEMQSLIPQDASFDVDKPLVVEQSLFNKAGLCKIIVPVGEGGIYYLELREGHALDKILVEPDDVVVDIFFGDGTLIYSFYNPVGSGSKNIVITAALVKDSDGIYDKLKSDPTDPIWRQYFVRRAIANLDSGPPIDSFPELMTAVQVAKYLQVKEKTIRNWTSEDKIPYSKINGVVRYKKAEIEAMMNQTQAEE